MKIYKYELKYGVVNLPAGAVLLSIKKVNNRLFAWAEVEPSNGMQPTLFVYHTGDEINLSHKHLGTFVMDNGDYVLHVFSEEKIQVTPVKKQEFQLFTTKIIN